MFVVILSVIVIVVTLVIKNCKRPKNFPPGPLLLPIIGSWYTLPPSGAERKIRGWRDKYGNLIGHKIGFRYLTVISGIDEIVSGLKNPNFQSRLHTKTLTQRSFRKILGLFFSEGESWSEVKKFTLRFLGQVSNNTLETVMHDEMMDWFSSVDSGKIAEVNSEFMNFSINIIFTILVGHTKNDFRAEVETIRTKTNRAFKNGRIMGIELFYPAMKIFCKESSRLKIEAVTYVQKFFKERLKERKATFDRNSIVDYVDAFLLEQLKEKESTGTDNYSDEQLISCLLDLVQASSESNANTAAFIILYVSLNPIVQRKLHAELDRVLGKEKFPKLEDRQNLSYCEATVYETMRINPTSGVGAGHIVIEDTEFFGYTLPRDTLLFFAHQDICMDPKIYSEPTLFKPERFLTKESRMKLTNFGLGKRACVGEIFARNFLFLFVTYFFQKYSVELPEGCTNPCTEPEYGFVNGPKPFKLLIRERY